MVSDEHGVIYDFKGSLVSFGDILLRRPVVTIIQIVPAVSPLVFFIQRDDLKDLAIFQQVDLDALGAVGIAVVIPCLVDCQLAILDGFYHKRPVYFTHSISILAAQGNGDIQFHLEREFFTFGQLAQEDIVRQSAGLIGSGIINQFRAVVDAHGQLLQEILHGGNCFCFGDFFAEGVVVFVVNYGLQIDIDIIAILGSVLECNSLGELVAGHHILEVVK